jgi:methyl-accepting chemotaxis protein
MERTKRSFLAWKGDKQFGMNTFLTVLCLVVVSGIAVLISNIAVLMQAGHTDLISQMIFYSVGAMLLVLIMASLVVFVYTQKIAGPLHQLKNGLERMVSGDLSNPISFRKDDEFKSVAVAANTLRDKFSKSLQDGATQAVKMDADVKDLMQKIFNDGIQNKNDVLEDLSGLKRHIDHLMGLLKIDGPSSR